MTQQQGTPPLVRMDSAGSTNEDIFRLYAEGQAAPFFLTADSQTQGRGRSGRSWDSPKGNLYLSALLENPAPSAALSQLGFVAGIALIDALVAVAHTKCFHLKWPNDILVDGAKLAGLLLETRTVKGKQVVVIGWGVNVATAPGNLAYRALALKDIAASADVEMLRQQLIKSFTERLQVWGEGKNFSAIRALWLQFALAPGVPLRVHAAENETIDGVFETIDEDGALLLKTKTGTTRILAGDVILPQAQQGAA